MPHVTAPAPSSAPVPVPVPVTPTATVVAPVAVASSLSLHDRYVNECGILVSMGFTDNDLNVYLLSNSKGDVQRVVEWLVRWGANAKSKVSATA
jgi:hypothetical protein